MPLILPRALLELKDCHPESSDNGSPGIKDKYTGPNFFAYSTTLLYNSIQAIQLYCSKTGYQLLD
ncbi:hypothetical protein D3C78_1723040 [compost metagenome]